VGDNTNRQVPVAVLETDRRNDLALLKLSSTSMASAETKSLISKLGIRIVSKSGSSAIPLSSNGLLRSEDVELGEDVLVSGFPYGDRWCLQVGGKSENRRKLLIANLSNRRCAAAERSLRHGTAYIIDLPYSIYRRGLV
jgi:hypothetical protein